MLALRDRFYFANGDLVAHLCGIAGIMDEVFLGRLEILFVFRVLYVALNSNRAGILHGRLHDDALKHFSIRFCCEHSELENLMSSTNFTAQAGGAYCREMWCALHTNLFGFESKIGAGRCKK